MFTSPFQLLWFVGLVVIIVLAIRAQLLRKKLLESLIELNLLNRIFSYKKWIRTRFVKNSLEIFALLLIIFALAGPLIGKKLKEVKTKGSNIFILVDCSDSMLAEDFKPNRMEKSKRLLTHILDGLVGSRVGIIAFAGEPYVYCPLTIDIATTKQFLKSIEPGMIPQPGTRIGSAIRLALSKLPEGKSSKAILLLTDGEDHRSDPLGAAEEAKKSGTTLFSIGIGNPEGEPIPIKDQTGKVIGFKKDKNNNVILSKLGESDLANIALATGGTYFRASYSEQEIDLLLQKLSESGSESSKRKVADFENQYTWFLGPAFLLLLLSNSLPFVPFRKPSPKSITTLALCCIILCNLSDWAVAGTFRRKMSEGVRQYKKEKYREAVESFNLAEGKKPSDLRSKFNKGAAYYRLKEWDKAAEEFKGATLSKDGDLAAKAFYNLGNSQFQKGDFKEAVKFYDACLKLNNKDEDAQFNRELALKMLQNPPQQKKENSKDKKGEKKDEVKAQEAKEAEDEKKENAKRMLKSVAEGEEDRPIFRPGKGKDTRTDIEDW